MINPGTGRVDISYQQMMDEKMCRPGYRWTGEPLNKCLPAVAYTYKKPGVPGIPTPSPDVPTPAPPVAEEPPGMPTPTPDEAVAIEMAARMKKKVA